MNHQIQDRCDFQLEANRVLSVESPARFNRKGVLTENEMQEADKACESGMLGEAFGRMIAERDQSKPIDLPKPLSEEHQRVIDLVRDHHRHTDRPLVLCESEFYVTLRIPKLPHGTWEGR